jgi:hypothetical protein
MEDFVVMAIRLRSCQFFDYFIDDSQAAIKLGRSRDILQVVRPKKGLPRASHNITSAYAEENFQRPPLAKSGLIREYTFV